MKTLIGPALACLALSSAGLAQTLHVEGPDGSSRLSVPEGALFRTIDRPAQAQAPARAPAGIPLPAGYQGGPATNFGGLVDVDGERLVFADATEVYVYNTTLGAYESNGLIADAPPFVFTAVEIWDVTIEGDWVHVVYGDNVINFDGLGATFMWDGAAWVLSNEQHIGFDDQGFAELHDGSSVFTLTQIGVSTRVGRQDPETGNFLGTPLINGERAVAFSVGDDPDGSLAALTTEDLTTGDRSVRAYRYDSTLNTFTDLGVVTTGSDADDYGGALAVADGLIWVGNPLSDAGAVDGGEYELWFDDGAGGWGFGGEIWSGQADDHFGRALAVDGDTLVSSERNADLLYLEVGVVVDVGSVRPLRHDGAGAWNLEGEIIHSFDQDYTGPDDFGADIALDGLTLLSGEPGGGGFVSWYFLPTTSQFDKNIGPAVAGLQGEPGGGNLGLTFNNMPNAFEIFGALPFGTAFLVLGLSEISAPFKTGVLYPSPDIIVPLPLDANGFLLLPYTWPDTPGPYTLLGQFWIQDASGPVGFTSTGGFSMRRD